MYRLLPNPPPEFIEARLNAHYASQLVAAPGVARVPSAEDFSHTALVWNATHAVLEGAALPGTSLRAGLRVSSLELVVLDEDVRATIPLAGRTLAEGLAALEAALPEGAALVMPEHELPAHPLAEGARFETDATLAQLEGWFENAAAILEVARFGQPASPVRLWPHHFDIATLITFDEGVDAEAARSIGVGLSPGDGSYAQPYWYVTPWPYPKDPSLASLPLGAWHTDGFFAAILTARALVAAGDDQAKNVDAFLDAAVAACRRYLGPD